MFCQGGSLLSHGDDDAVSWIEEVASTGGGTTSAIAGGSGNATTQSGTSQTPNNTTTLSPAEVRLGHNLYNLTCLQFIYTCVIY